MLGLSHMHVHPAYAPALRALGIDHPRAVLERVEGQIVAWSRTTDTLYVPSSGPTGFYLKRYHYPTFAKRLRGALRGTIIGPHRGQAEFDLLNRMSELAVPAVRPVAYGCRRSGGFVTACFLITEEAPGACNLTTFAQDVREGRCVLNAPMRRRMLENLARTIGRMHATGFAHGQLYWRNILIRTDPNGEPEYFLLDPRPLRAARSVSRPRDWWVDELAQVSASSRVFTTRGERLQFLRHYLDERGIEQEVRELALTVAKRSRGMAAHEAQRLRMSRLFGAWSRELSREARLDRNDSQASPHVERASA